MEYDSTKYNALSIKELFERKNDWNLGIIYKDMNEC